MFFCTDSAILALTVLPVRWQSLKLRDDREMNRCNCLQLFMPVVWSVNLTVNNSRGFGEGKDRRFESGECVVKRCKCSTLLLAGVSERWNACPEHLRSSQEKST